MEPTKVETAARHRTPAEWQAWEETQPERHEFVGEQPRLMSGGTLRHGDITANLLVLLRSALRGGPCQAFAADIKVRHPGGRWAYPDLVVRCGDADHRATAIDDPVVVIEVLSLGTENYDLLTKRWFYQDIPSLRQILFVAQDEVEVVTRGEDGTWRSVFHLGTERAVEIEWPPATLPLAAVYEGTVEAGIG